MLRLRPYRESDADIITGWIKDEQTFRKWSADLFQSYPINGQDLNDFYYDFGKERDFWIMTAIDDAKIVGQLFMFFTNDEKTKVRFGFVIVDDSIRGRGYGKEMLKLAAKYAFEILKVEKISLGVFENNENAYRCYSSIGFKQCSYKYYNIMNQQWKGIEMELEKKDF